MFHVMSCVTVPMLNSISGRISLGSYGAIDGLTRHFAEGLDELGTQESEKTFQTYGQSFDYTLRSQRGT